MNIEEKGRGKKLSTTKLHGVVEVSDNCRKWKRKGGRHTAWNKKNGAEGSQLPKVRWFSEQEEHRPRK